MADPTNDLFSRNIQGFYQKYLGRTASPEEISSWIQSHGAQGTAGMPDVENQIKNSDEGQAYAKALEPPPPPPKGGGAPPPPPTPNPWSQYDPGVWQSGDQFSQNPSGANPTTRAAWIAAHPGDRDVYGIGGHYPTTPPPGWKGGPLDPTYKGPGGGTTTPPPPDKPPPGTTTGPGPAGPAGPAGAAGAAGPTPGGPTYTAPPAFNKPPPFQYADFTGPTPGEAFNDPGYQFGLGQGLDSLQRWAAARGTLNDSGTAKGLFDYGLSSAGQQYKSVWDRDMGAYMANRTGALNTYNTNYGTQYTDPYAINYASQYKDPFAFQTQTGMNTYQAQAANTDRAQQNAQFYSNLGQTATQFDRGLGSQNRQFDASLGFQNRQLGSQNRQFDASLGSNNRQFDVNAAQHVSDQNQYYGFQTWLQDYYQKRTTQNDQFDQRYRLLGLL